MKQIRVELGEAELHEIQDALRDRRTDLIEAINIELRREGMSPVDQREAIDHAQSIDLLLAKLGLAKTAEPAPSMKISFTKEQLAAGLAACADVFDRCCEQVAKAVECGCPNCERAATRKLAVLEPLAGFADKMTELFARAK